MGKGDDTTGWMAGSEEDARLEIARTRVSPWARRILCGGMMSFMAGVCLTDAPGLAGEWARLAGALRGPAPDESRGTATTERVLAWNDGVIGSIGKLEERFDLDSPLCRWVQPRMQGVLARMGEGGDEVMIGRDGWLFYRPSFRHLTAPAELGGGRVAEGRGYAAALAAASEFAACLRERGITLVVVPVPPKLAVHPEKFIDGDHGGTVEAAGYRTWVRQLEERGVRVFDTAGVLSSFRGQSQQAAYLRTDTHWRPEAMEWCAGQLAEFLEAEGLVKGARDPQASILTAATVAGTGDLTRMLGVGETGATERTEEVPLHQVRTAKGMRWQPSRAGEVLLLGDSFCNIFSLDPMGWGEGAGFAEHLGHRLQRPVDAILRNSGGAHATRQILAQELARGIDRLAGKSVVVWEFAARELTEGRWTRFDCRLGEKSASRFVEVAPGGGLEVEATVVDVSPLPCPGSVPYQDFVATVHLRDLSCVDGGDPGGTEALAYARAMEGNRWTDLAGLRGGQRVRVRLDCWSDQEGRFGRWNRSEPPEELLLEPVNWLSKIGLARDGM